MEAHTQARTHTHIDCTYTPQTHAHTKAHPHTTSVQFSALTPHLSTHPCHRHPTPHHTTVLPDHEDKTQPITRLSHTHTHTHTPLFRSVRDTHPNQSCPHNTRNPSSSTEYRVTRKAPRLLSALQPFIFTLWDPHTHTCRFIIIHTHTC